MSGLWTGGGDAFTRSPVERTREVMRQMLVDLRREASYLYDVASRDARPDALLGVKELAAGKRATLADIDAATGRVQAARDVETLWREMHTAEALRSTMLRELVRDRVDPRPVDTDARALMAALLETSRELLRCAMPAKVTPEVQALSARLVDLHLSGGTPQQAMDAARAVRRYTERTKRTVPGYVDQLMMPPSPVSSPEPPPSIA